MPAVYSEIIAVCFVVLGGYFIFTARAVKSTKRADSRTWNLVHNGFMLLGSCSPGRRSSWGGSTRGSCPRVWPSRPSECCWW